MKNWFTKNREFMQYLIVCIVTGLCVVLCGVVNASGPKLGRKIDPVITVGGPDADIQGYTNEHIQEAINQMKKRCGGTVVLQGGTYMIYAPLRLSDNIHLTGSDPETILCQADGFFSLITTDIQPGHRIVRVKDASGFKPGMGIQIFENEAKNWAVATAVITAVEDDLLHFQLDRINPYCGREYRVERNGLISSNCSVIQAIGVTYIRLTNLTILGEKTSNPHKINGCVGGAIYILQSSDCVLENVTVRDFNGDGISWQETYDVTVRNCFGGGCSNYGMHPGTGSVNNLIESCVICDNGSNGIFLCFNVTDSRIRNNLIFNDGRDGISIGHQDTDNIFSLNRIHSNARHGVGFRDDDIEDAGHGNSFLNNSIEKNGKSKPGYGIYIAGFTKGIRIFSNDFGDTGDSQLAGVFVGKNAKAVMRDNRCGSTDLVPVYEGR